MSEHTLNAPPQANFGPGKFCDPDCTTKGEVRASVALDRLETFWINTGSLCNIECLNCYIESGPANDRLVYFSLTDANALFDEIEHLALGTHEIGFTGGEPFMNPEMLAMVAAALKRGFKVLILTNAMQPMMRPLIRQGLIDLNRNYPGQMELRVSLDHYSERLHDMERGPGAFAKAVVGLDWLTAHEFNIAVAGRTCWNEDEAEARLGYAQLFKDQSWPIETANHRQLILFPEMDESVDIPEITVECWGILGVKPGDMMCASSRMAVKRKGDGAPAIMPCTLLPYDATFEMGSTLARSLHADGGAFSKGSVKLNHPHCAKFCVLGGGSCSVESES